MKSEKFIVVLKTMQLSKVTKMANKYKEMYFIYNVKI